MSDTILQSWSGASTPRCWAKIGVDRRAVESWLGSVRPGHSRGSNLECHLT